MSESLFSLPNMGVFSLSSTSTPYRPSGWQNSVTVRLFCLFWHFFSRGPKRWSACARAGGRNRSRCQSRSTASACAWLCFGWSKASSPCPSGDQARTALVGNSSRPSDCSFVLAWLILNSNVCLFKFPKLSWPTHCTQKKGPRTQEAELSRHSFVEKHNNSSAQRNLKKQQKGSCPSSESKKRRDFCLS